MPGQPEFTDAPAPTDEDGAVRILVATDTYPPTINGAAVFAERLARTLGDRGHEVHVVCPSPHGAPETIVDQSGVMVHRRRSVPNPAYGNFRLTPPGFGHGVRLLEDLRPDVVHVQDHFWLCAAMTRAARSLGVPFIATNHMMPENYFDHVPLPIWLRRSGARWVWKEVDRVWSGASAVTTPTSRAVELLRRSTAFGAAIPISNGIDAARYEAASARYRDQAEHLTAPPRILFVGRLDKEKRVDELISALALIAPFSDACLDIVGDGPMRGAWDHLAGSLGLSTRVRFHGFVGEEELVEAFGRADIFVMPGVAELQSIATMEAMAAGTPIVAADAMALPHLVKPGRNGFLFTPGRVTDLAGRLRQLLDDPALRQRMGAESRRIVAVHDMTDTVDQFERLYAAAAHRAPTVGGPRRRLALQG